MELPHDFNFAPNLKTEREALGLSTSEIKEPAGCALALSGGGVRSASFALGAVQGLLVPASSGPDEKRTSAFESFDFMSTVSGGGYLGGAISWLKFHQGTHGLARNLGVENISVPGPAVHGPKESRKYFTWLHYLQQHADYLRPASMPTLSVAGVAIRGALITLIIYIAIAAGLLAAARMGHILPEYAYGWQGRPQRVESFALFFLLSIFAVYVYTSLTSWASNVSPWISLIALLAAAGGSSYFAVGLVTADLTSIHFDPEGLHWRWPVAAAFALAGVLLWLFFANVVRELNEPADRESSRISAEYSARIVAQRILGAIVPLLAVCLVVMVLPPIYAMYGKLTAYLALGCILVGFVAIALRALLGGMAHPIVAVFAFLCGAVSTILLIFGILLSAFYILYVFEGQYFSVAGVEIAAVFFIAFIGLLAGLLVDPNHIGIGKMYRDRIIEAFMPDLDVMHLNQWRPAKRADRFRLATLANARLRDSPGETAGVQRPLHLVCCNVLLANANTATFRERGGDSFVLSPISCGSSATGWVETASLAQGKLKLADAIAASGAALSPNAGVAGAGVTRQAPVSFAMSLASLRLSYWIRNPMHSLRSRFWHRLIAPSLVWPGLRQGLLWGGSTERAFFVELTDGGHFDNTGIYELVRRRVKVIVAIQASEDRGFTFDDLVNAILRVRTDFGVHISFDNSPYPLDAIRPRADGFAERPFAIAKIHYPSTNETGVLLYVQASPIHNLGPICMAYLRRNSAFPNESTGNQFFGTHQLEAYRELGVASIHSAYAALTNPEKLSHGGADSEVEKLTAALRWR